MPSFRVLLTDYAWSDVDCERQVLAAAGAELIVAPASDTATLVALAADVDAVLTCWARVPAELIAAAPRLKIVGRLGIGLDNIDVAECTRRGVLVTNVPDYCLDEVAEHALALLLACARQVAFYHHETKSGRYDLQAGLPLRRLRGQVLGLVGYGATAQALARRAGGLGLRLLVTSRTARRVSEGLAWVPLDVLLAESDYISLHVPATEETRHLINARTLALCKTSAYLINTSRGAVVDESALLAALEHHRLAGAALDVQAVEPPDLAAPLFRHPRVIVTPHAAFYSEESLVDLRTRAAQQVADGLLGRRPANVVNA